MLKFKMFGKNDNENKIIIESLNKQDIIKKFLTLLIGTFLSALSFNLFFVPNNFVSSGLSGLAIIISKYTNMDAQTLVFFGDIFLIGIALLTLGGEKSLKTIIGTGLYLSFMFLTQNIVETLNFSFDNILLYVLAAGVVSGIGEAMVYKVGYNTGGTSIIALIINKYSKQQIGKLIRYMGFVIIIIGGFTFGYTMIMYSLIIVSISTVLIDRVLIGVSDSKMFMIHTEKEEEVKNFVMEVIENGVTVFDSKGGYSEKKNKILMCVVPTEKYYYLTEAIKEIDPSAFIVVSDCYEVLGGTKRQKLTFPKILK